MRRLDILGKRFGHMIAVEELPRDKGMRKWRLRCDCGAEHTAFQKAFCSGGKMTSCGCQNKHQQVFHGLSKIPEYRLWFNMKSRCYNENTPYYHAWGGRGIKVYDEWRESFEAFFRYVGSRPTPRHSLDRIDNDGNYEPGNVRWAVRKIQCRNVRSNHIVNLDGRRITLAEAVEDAPVPYNTVLYRLKRGWSIDTAITLPARKGYRPDASQGI